jgi:transcriptional regulator with XRE-family HTH domain
MAIRDIRARRRAEAPKYTISELADVLGVTTSTALRYDLDASKLSYEQAIRVAKWLKCKPSDLFD